MKNHPTSQINLVQIINTELYYLIRILKKTNLNRTTKFAEHTYEIFEKELRQKISEKRFN